MSVPRWSQWLLRRVAPPDGVEDVLGDMEDAHRARVRRRGGLVAHAVTAVETVDVDMVVAMARERRGQGKGAGGGTDNGSGDGGGGILASHGWM